MCQVKFGVTNPNEVSAVDNNWYSITSWTDATHFVLSSAGPSASGVPYVIRICWSGQDIDYHSVCFPYNDERADKIIMVTNGIDPVQEWDSTGYFEDTIHRRVRTCTLTSGSAVVALYKTIDLYTGMTVTGSGIQDETVVQSVDSASQITLSKTATTAGDADLTFTGDKPRRAKYIGYWGSVGYEHVVVANTVDGSILCPQTVEISQAGQTDCWPGIIYDLLNTNEPILGILPLRGHLFIYKANSISEMWPDPSGGNDDPFNFNQDKVNKGTPSIRTVVNFGSFHIFYSGQQVYRFDGISATPIGADVVKYLNRVQNRDNLKRAFAFAVEDKNLYCLFVPTGDGGVYPDKVFVYDYVQNFWTIWTISNMTAFGFWLQEYAPDCSELSEPVLTCNGTISTTNITGMTASTVDLVEGMLVEGTGVPSGTTISGITGPGSITISNSATAGTVALSFYHTYASMLSMGVRCRDMLVYADNTTILLGDTSGQVHEFNDAESDNGVEIPCSITTRDYPLNDPKHAFRLLGCVLGMVSATGDIRIRASVDFGHNWSEWITVSLAGTPVYFESIVKFILRGKQVRFQIENVAGSAFEIESLIVEYNDGGI